MVEFYSKCKYDIHYIDAMGKGCLMMSEILKVSRLNMTRQPALMALG